MIERTRFRSRSTFLRAHFGVTAATDFYSVEVLTFSGFVRDVVWFVIDLDSRRVHIAGLARYPHDGGNDSCSP